MKIQQQSKAVIKLEMFAVRNSSITMEENAQLTQLSGLTKTLNWKDLGLVPKEETGVVRRSRGSGDM